jgi:hypothetical protein
MKKIERYCRRDKLHDPEPLAIAAFVLAAVATPATIYQAISRRINVLENRWKRRQNKKAVIIRWQAAILDFGDLLEELKEFLTSLSPYRNKELLSMPLEPLANPLYLDNRELRKYRKLIGKLASQGKKLSDTTCDLLPEIEDKKLGGFLEESLPRARELLKQIKKMESLEKVLSAGHDFIEELKKVAEYLSKEIVD